MQLGPQRGGKCDVTSVSLPMAGRSRMSTPFATPVLWQPARPPSITKSRATARGRPVAILRCRPCGGASQRRYGGKKADKFLTLSGCHQRSGCARSLPARSQPVTATPDLASSYGATTGLFSPASAVVAVTSAGAELMRVNATGVGIGTTSPSYLLHVGSPSAVGVVADFQNSSGYCTFSPSSRPPAPQTCG
jgi:hypothetical protein